jgi:Uma2 family endonuclease
MSPGLVRHRFTVADYERMIEAGILTEDDRVELIAGEIVEMAAMGARHVECVGRTNGLHHRLAGDGVIVHSRSAIRLSNDGEPEPDIAVVRDRDYEGELPTADDTLLVIEVADTTLHTDRQVKLPLYAAAGIPEAWLFDLTGETIERHTAPVDGRYTLIAVAGRGNEITSTVLPSVTIPASIIPPPKPGRSQQN